VAGIDAGASTRTDEVYQALYQDLLSGRMTPGDRLRLLELSARFEVSQSVTREALVRLAEQGLVVANPQRGFRVRDLSVQDIEALTEARVQIELVALQLAIERGDIHWETSVVASHHLLEKTSVVSADGRFNEEWAQRHRAFHRALLSGCANPHLEAVAAELRDCAELYRRWYWVLSDENDRIFETEHRLLKELALARETNSAQSLLRTHIERVPLKLVAYAAEHDMSALDQQESLPPRSDSDKAPA
jgi:DNA-binding GntR family transcriptional regulator